MIWTREHYLRFATHFLIAHIPVLIFLLLTYLLLSVPLWLLVAIGLTITGTGIRSSFKKYIAYHHSQNLFIISSKTENLTIADELKTTNATLNNLGFQLIRKATIRQHTDQEHIEWQYYAPDDATYALVIPPDNPDLSPLVNLLTPFQNEKLVETRYGFRYQNGLVIHEHDWHLTTVRGSLEESYNFHMQQVAKFEAQGNNIQSYISIEELDTWYRNSFSERERKISYQHYRKYNSVYKVTWASFFIMLYFFIVFFVPMVADRMLFSELPDFFTKENLIVFISMIITMTLFCIYILLIPRGYNLENDKKAK